MSIRKIAAAVFVVAAAISACGDSEPNACDELDQLTASGDSEALAADAEDPDGAFMRCASQIGDRLDDMSPEERDAFLYGD